LSNQGTSAAGPVAHRRHFFETSVERSLAASRCRQANDAGRCDRQDHQRHGAVMAYASKADQAAAAKAHYEANKPAYVARARAASVIGRARVIEHIRSYLSAHPCLDCGEPDLVVLEFDHRPDVEKKFNIGESMKRGVSLPTLIAEIAKCDVRCANCHRRKTYRERGFTHRT
jgi:hypothetical protein